MTDADADTGRDADMPWTREQARPHWDPPPNPEEAGERAYNLACGTDVKEGWINVDFYAPDVDEDWDLLDVPWPLPDDSADRVLMDQFLEHVPPLVEGVDGEPRDGALVVLGELGRILRPGGVAYVGVPYAGSYEDVQNICHYRRFNEGTLDFLRPDDGGNQGYQQEIALDLRHVQVIRYWTNLLGFLHTGYHLGRRTELWPNVGPKQQIAYVVEGKKSPVQRASPEPVEAATRNGAMGNAAGNPSTADPEAPALRGPGVSARRADEELDGSPGN